jgi:acid phosphatase type 7
MGSGAAIVSDMLLNTNYPFFTIGDDSNDTGTAADYANCYNPTWGRLKSRTYPVIGNHDFIADPQARPYFAYFAGQTGIYGHYSVNLGAWHIIILNSDCSIGGQKCGAGGAQETWLRKDLAANNKKCIMALWHEPLYTSGREAPDAATKTFWQDLYQAGATLILNGHNHNYERFLPQNPDGEEDEHGIIEIVVGTGGAGTTQTGYPLAPNEVVRNADTLGYLKLALYKDSVSWRFMPQKGKTFTDSGSANCNSED